MQRLVVAAFVVGALLAYGVRVLPTAAATSPPVERPLILEAGQGEVRMWRPLASLPPAVQKLSTFIIKVDRKNGGSPDFWFGTETMPVGAEISYHRHLHEDEVLFIGSGTAHVHVGSLEGDAHQGAIVFIPRDTWVTVKNVGKTPIALLFGFNAPEFDRFMRCESVRVGQPAPPVTEQEDKACTKEGDVEYR